MQGDTVVWTVTSGSHNVNGSTTTFPNNPASFGPNAVGSSWTFSHTFTVAGTYNYQCDPHAPAMAGTITVTAAPAVPCTKPFFSEYIEGSGNNKALEIYNPSSSSLNLGGYKVVMSSNGGSSTTELVLSGTVASGDVYVIANNASLAPVLAAADTTFGFPSVVNFNGDDAVFLWDTITNDTLDIIGVVGVDPGTNWVVGTGATSEFTLVRMSSVSQGQKDWTIGATEWNVHPQNTSTFIGAHTSGCVTTPCVKPFFSEYIEGSGNNKALEIYNPSSSSLNLGGYKVVMSSNGGPNTTELVLSGTVASGDVYVIANNASLAAVLAAADTTFGFPSVVNFNGDDAVFLWDTITNDTVDIIGVVGVDPGSNWTVGTGATSEFTLVRKSSVNIGQKDWTIGATEWDVHPQNTSTFIGAHTSNCIAGPANPTVNFAITNVTALESAGSVQVDVILNPAPTVASTVDLTFALGAGINLPADGSVVPAPNLVTGLLQLPVLANEDSVSFTINITDDAIVEGNETLFVAVTAVSAGLTIGTNNAMIFVVEDNDFRTGDIASVSSVDPATLVPDSLGITLITYGVVYTDDFDGNNGHSFYIQDATGGINVFNFNDVSNYTVTRGDSIRVIGEIAQFRGLTEIIADSIAVLKAGATIDGPTTVTNLDETTEGEFIQLDYVQIIDPTQWTNSGSGFNVDITNGVDTFIMRIDNDVNLFGQPIPTTGLFTVRGAGSQFSTATPANDGYQIFPRDTNDIIPINEMTIDAATTLNASLEPVELDNRLVLTGVVYTDDFDGNNGYSFYMYDNTGGINVFNFSDVSGYAVTRGDSIRVRGYIEQFRGLTEIFAEDIEVLKSGVALKTAATVSVLDETTEGEFIHLAGWNFVDPTQWTTGSGSGGFNVDITNGVDTFIMRIDADIDLYNMPIPTTGVFDVYGAGSQFSFSSPANDGYQIFPRDSADIIINVSLAEVAKPVISVYPNPVSSTLFVERENNAPAKVTITNITGAVVRYISTSDKLIEVDARNLTSGTYVIAVEVDGVKTTRKIVVR
jgi:predicted extracellular nuclease